MQSPNDAVLAVAGEETTIQLIAMAHSKVLNILKGSISLNVIVPLLTLGRPQREGSVAQGAALPASSSAVVGERRGATVGHALVRCAAHIHHTEGSWQGHRAASTRRGTSPLDSCLSLSSGMAADVINAVFFVSPVQCVHPDASRDAFVIADESGKLFVCSAGQSDFTEFTISDNPTSVGVHDWAAFANSVGMGTHSCRLYRGCRERAECARCARSVWRCARVRCKRRGASLLSLLGLRVVARAECWQLRYKLPVKDALGRGAGRTSAPRRIDVDPSGDFLCAGNNVRASLLLCCPSLSFFCELQSRPCLRLLKQQLVPCVA